MLEKIKGQVLGYLLGGIFALIILPTIVLMLAFLIDKLMYVELLHDKRITIICSIVFIGMGLIFSIWSNTELYSVGKGGPFQIGNIEISKKTKHLVVSGPYRYSRNPMLFGAFMMYFGIGFIKNTLSIFLAIVLLLAIMLICVVRSEEKRLKSDFGEEYEEYKKRTSMLLPWFQKSE